MNREDKFALIEAVLEELEDQGIELSELTAKQFKAGRKRIKAWRRSPYAAPHMAVDGGGPYGTNYDYGGWRAQVKKSHPQYDSSRSAYKRQRNFFSDSQKLKNKLKTKTERLKWKLQGKVKKLLKK